MSSSGGESSKVVAYQGVPGAYSEMAANQACPEYNLPSLKFHIVGETFVAVDHCLMALPGVEKKDVKKVMSHPQALAQTEGYTRALG
eukprot:jgi/Picre1/32686/NNA_008031.t1